MYSVEFASTTHVVSVSYEPGDDYLLVVVFTVRDGVRSDIDDRRSSPRLPDLNRRFLHASDADELSHRRSGGVLDPEEQRIQRVGAELAIVLPRYLQSLGNDRARIGPATPRGTPQQT
ncbi:MAG TPA: hypothetical protein VFI92_09460, partial [Steroidobacteraceae bacterium]|nr:hypothetical protein [Steroidobacteraceae bacterium]